MITSGQHSRSISTQSGGVLDFDIRFQDEIGSFDVGISGTNFFGVSCRSGQLSIEGNRFSSIENDSKRIFIDYNNSFYNLSVDGVQLINGGSKPTGVYEHLVFNSSNNIESSLFVSGQEPQLTFQVLNNSQSGNSIVSGLLLNSTADRRFRIFDAYVDSLYSSRFAVTGWDTGICDNQCLVELLSLENQPSSASGVKINFDSNFGPFSFIANIPSDFSGVTEIFTVSPSQDTFFNSAGSKLFNVLSYYQGPPRHLEVTLEYVSGGLSDQLVSLESGIVSGDISGFIRGCGTLTGSVTQYLTNITGMSGFVFSGDATGTISRTYCHTGQLVWTGFVNMSGIVPSGPSAGQIYYYDSGVALTGTVLDGSGSYNFNQVFSGTTTSGFTSIPVTGTISRTEYLYSTQGRIAGTGVSGINLVRTDTACGLYTGTTLLTQTKPYFFNESGWSGWINTTFSGFIVPTGIYSKVISGMGTGTGVGATPISGMLTGTVTGLIDNSSGVRVFNGSLTGLLDYTYSGCAKSGDRLVGDIQSAITNLYDGYAVKTGALYTFGFSPTRDYLLGSGFPCNVYLSGYTYEGSSTGTVIPINEVRVEIRNRANSALIASKYLTEFIRFQGVEIESGVMRTYPVHRVAVPELTGFNLTGEVYITGYWLHANEFEETAWENFFNLTLVPYMSGLISGTAPITYPYSHTGYLTGSGCATATGNVSGTVSGIWTLLNGTGYASGYLLGPQVPVNFADMWNLKTGVGQYVYDFKQSGWYGGGLTGKFENPTGSMLTRQNFFNEPFIEVYYDRALNNDVSIAKLSVFDEYNLEEIFISGF